MQINTAKFKQLVDNFKITIVDSTTICRTTRSQLTLESYSVDHGWAYISVPDTIYTLSIPENELYRLLSVVEDYNTLKNSLKK